MNASAKTEGNLSSINEVERKLTESIDRLKDIKQDIKDFRTLIIPNRFDQTKSRAGYSFMAVSSSEKSTNIGKDSIGDSQETRNNTAFRYAEISEKALDYIERIFHCKINRDYRLRGFSNIIFDGYTTIEGEPYVFEVKRVSLQREP